MASRSKHQVDAVFAGAISAFLVGWFSANTSLLEGFRPLMYLAAVLIVYLIFNLGRARRTARKAREKSIYRAKQEIEEAYAELEAQIAAEETEWPLFARWLLVVMQENGGEITRVGSDGYLLGSHRISEANSAFGPISRETLTKVNDAFTRLVALGAITMLTRGSGHLSSLGYERAKRYASSIDVSTLPTQV